MTNLCFATEGLDGPVSDSENFMLVHEASVLVVILNAMRLLRRA